jgi:hypothetical protein
MTDQAKPSFILSLIDEENRMKARIDFDPPIEFAIIEDLIYNENLPAAINEMHFAGLEIIAGLLGDKDIYDRQIVFEYMGKDLEPAESDGDDEEDEEE